MCLAAVAMAESDPALLVNPYHIASPYYANPLVYSHAVPSTYIKPATYVKPVVTLKKAEEIVKPVEVKTYKVEVEGEKKFEVPAISYKTPVVGTTYAATNIFGAPVAYSTGVVGAQETIVPARYHAQSEGEVKHTVFEREAEADPALVYAANAYHAGIYNPYVARAYATYAAPAAIATYPSAYYGVPAGVKTYANDAVRPENYAAKGQYVAQSAGAIHIAKREAEADPALVYANTLGYPYTTAAAAYTTAGYVAPSVYSTAYTTPFVNT